MLDEGKFSLEAITFFGNAIFSNCCIICKVRHLRRQLTPQRGIGRLFLDNEIKLHLLIVAEFKTARLRGWLELKR